MFKLLRTLSVSPKSKAASKITDYRFHRFLLTATDPITGDVFYLQKPTQLGSLQMTTDKTQAACVAFVSPPPGYAANGLLVQIDKSLSSINLYLQLLQNWAGVGSIKPAQPAGYGVIHYIGSPSKSLLILVL